VNDAFTVSTAMKSVCKVLLAASRENAKLQAARNIGARSRLHGFEITESPQQADIVLYFEDGYIGPIESLRVLQCVQALPSALHFLYSEADWPFPILPGAYAALDRPCPWARSWAYLPGAPIAVDDAESLPEAKFLFSFLGRAATHRVRKDILLLDSEQSPCVDVNAAPERFAGFDYSKSYWKLIADSQFVLCPRGFGVSSIRTFEVMAAGRVPVIISDRWQRTPGISWDDFCVFVAEKDVRRVPTILRTFEYRHAKMGKLAQDTYRQFFAPDVFLDRLLQMMVKNYSGFRFGKTDNVWRALRAARWREMWTVLSEAKSHVISFVDRPRHETGVDE
jgi:hypothetical protein